MSHTPPSPSDFHELTPDEKPNWRLYREPPAPETKQPSLWASWILAAVALISWLGIIRIFTRDGGL